MEFKKLIGASAIAGLALFGAGQASAYVVGPTVPGKWGPGPLGTGAVVTYSYIATGVSCGAECAGGTFTGIGDFMPAGAKAAIDAAFDAWEAVADITFLEVVDGGEAHNAAPSSDIRIGGHAFDGAGGTLAHGYFPPANGLGAAGDIHFDIAEAWKVDILPGVDEVFDIAGGFDIFQVAAHEIGHAIGLSHTGVAGSLMNPFYTEAFVGLQGDDIDGAQHIYGRRDAGVPEPLTGAMVLGGLVLLGLRRRA